VAASGRVATKQGIARIVQVRLERKVGIAHRSRRSAVSARPSERSRVNSRRLTVKVSMQPSHRGTEAPLGIEDSQLFGHLKLGRHDRKVGGLAGLGAYDWLN